MRSMVKREKSREQLPASVEHEQALPAERVLLKRAAVRMVETTEMAVDQPSKLP